MSLIICADCIWEADGITNGDFTFEEVRQGNKELPQYAVGHDACKGDCPCQHKNPADGHIDRSAING